MAVISRLSTSRVRSTTPGWYYLAAAFFIMQETGFLSFIDTIIYGNAGVKSIFSQFLNGLQIPVSIVLFWSGYNKSKRLNLGAKLLLVTMAYLFMSVLWSVDPSTSLRRSFIYLFFVLGAIGIANTLSGDEYMQLMKRIIFFSAVVSLVFLVISPSTVLMPDGALRGIFTHKNVLGQVMAAGVLASLHGVRAGSARWPSSVAMIILFVGVTIAARSSTSLIVSLIFCVVELLMIISGSYFLLVFAFVSIPVLIVLVYSPDLILDFLGKDATLTGRTDLWYFVDICISQRPILGWGFSAFWEPTNPAASEISMNLGWNVPQAHHGLRELLLEIGAIGTSLVGIVFVRNIWIALRCLRTLAKELGETLLLCCGGILIVGVSEEVLVDPGQISVGMLFVMGLTVEKMLYAVPQRQHPRPMPPTSLSLGGRTRSVKLPLKV